MDHGGAPRGDRWHNAAMIATHRVPRRRRLTALLAFMAVACSLGQSQELSRRDGRLTARPGAVASAPAPGFMPLSLGRDRDGLLFVPKSAANGPVPLVVLLHGAGGSSDGMRRRMFGTSDSIDFAVLIPDSRGPTWDAIRGIYGPDIAFIDSALKLTFSRVPIDRARIIVSGFSDGASYALALGRINGDLFSRIVAFSPGFIPASTGTGKPAVYVTHGDGDQILPFEATSQRIVPALRRAGYTVTLKQFVGGHTVPLDLMRDAFLWATMPSPEAKKPG
jgi:predicted esterase